MTRLARRGLLAALFSLGLTLACAPPSGGDGGAPDAGASDAGGGGGGGGNNDAGGGGGGNNDAGGGGTDLELGAACTFGSDECGEGKVCTSIFQAQGGGVDESSAACYAACDTQGAACTAAFDLAGTCQQSQQGLICVVQSPNLGPCGNGANASCSDTPVCLFLQQGDLVGFCGTVCDPEDPSTCTALADQGMPNDGCGCADTQACSTSPLTVGMGGDGLCAPPSTEGDTCGIDVANATLGVCTGDLQCAVAQGTTTGTCQLPDTGDAGVPGDAG